MTEPLTCPACGNTADIAGCQYDWDEPECYDGVSEWHCPCGCRWGHWTGKVLGPGEVEPRYGRTVTR